MRIFPVFAFLLLVLIIPPPGRTAGVTTRTFYVAQTGKDTNPGTRTNPFATLGRARHAVRDSRQLLPGQAVTVILRAGIFHLDSSFLLGPDDSGDSLAPVRYSGAKGETVRLSGGRELRDFHLVTDSTVLNRLDPQCAGHVFETTLAQSGISDPGRLMARGFGRPLTPAGLELFFNDVPMTLARWPNEGWTSIADTVSGARESLFVFSGDRPQRWVSSQDAWMHGYWTWDWADSYVRIDSINLARKIIRTRAPHGAYGYTKGKRFHVLNVLEELDNPGEYFVDRERGALYFWPPAPLRGARVTASENESPLIVLKDASWVTISNMTIECTRGAGVVIEGGHDNLIAGCKVRNIGTVGISIGALEPSLAGMIGNNTLFDARGGKRNGVQSCEISACGEGGVILCGGDRRTLEQGKNFVDNCHLTDCSRWVHTYRAAVFMWGVGNRVSHSLIHGLPHSAVFFWGNDHAVEYNEVYEVCRETGDAGAFYQGRDWTQRGNLIRHNYFHDLRGVAGGEGFTDVMAVYMDDFASGTTVSGNVFINAGRSVMIGGGRDNTVDHNLFINGTPAVHVDARGSGWAKFMIDGTNAIMNIRIRQIAGVKSLYENRYPPLARLLADEPALPKGNIVRNNISYGGTWRDLLDGVNDTLVSFTNNIVDQDPGFVSQEKKDFRLRPDAPALRNGFLMIPTEKIGLYRDPYRLTVPRRRNGIPGSVLTPDEF